MAEREELEPKVGTLHDWREQQRITQRVQELTDALRQVNAGLVVAGFSHPAVEQFLRANGEPAPASNTNVWTMQRYSALPMLRDRLKQSQVELSAVEEKIRRESC